MDISHLANRPKDGSFDLEAYEQTVEHRPNHGKIVPQVEESKNNKSGTWSSDSDDSDNSDDSDSDESMDDGKHKKKNKQLNPKKATAGLSKKMVRDAKAKDFFKDLWILV